MPEKPRHDFCGICPHRSGALNLSRRVLNWVLRIEMLPPDPFCEGPEQIHKGISMAKEPTLGLLSVTFLTVDMCPRDITPEIRRASEAAKRTTDELFIDTLEDMSRNS